MSAFNSGAIQRTEAAVCWRVLAQGGRDGGGKVEGSVNYFLGLRTMFKEVLKFTVK